MTSFYRTWIRPFIPFPHRSTIRNWFPPWHERNLVRLMADEGIDLVLDVGANAGQFARQIRKCGYRGRIVSFEPVGEVHARLAAAAAGDPAWTVAPPLALGARSGEIEINVHRVSEFSSVLPLERMPSREPDGAAIPPLRRELVPMMPLDEVIGGYLKSGERVLLKLDVQGYETDVLAGARESLHKVAAILIEVSLAPIYTGQPSYLEMLGWLRDRGFHAVSFSPVDRRPPDGAQWEYNVFAVRKPLTDARPRPADRE